VVSERAGHLKRAGGMIGAMEDNEITRNIIDAAVRLHKVLGPGLLESVYEMALAKSLLQRSLKVERQVPVGFDFDGIHFDDAFRIDLLVEDRIIVELKPVELLKPVHFKQIATYIRLMDKPLGLLLNFGEAVLKDGIHRIINNNQSGPGGNLPAPDKAS